MSPSPMSPPPSAPDTKNLAIAIALSLAILLGFQYFYEMPREKARVAEMAQKREAQAAAQKTAAAQPAVTPVQAAASAGQPVSRPDALGLSQRISIDADAVSGTVSTLGGRFDDLVLKRYQDTIKKDSKAVTLLHPQGTADGYYAFFGFTAPDGSAGALPGPNTIWQAKAGEKLTPATPITLTYDNGQGLTFKRVVKVDKNYLFTVTDTVVNAGAAPVTLQPYGALRRHAKPKEPPNGINHEGMVGMFDGKLKLMNYQKLEKGEALQQAGTGGWLGITDK